MQYPLTIVVFLSELPITDWRGITVDKIQILNQAVTELVADLYQGKVHIFDAYLPLQARHNEICRKYRFPWEHTREWQCPDLMHTGFVINNHYAQMLINFLCNP